MPKTIDRSPHTAPVPDDVLRKVADLGRVSAHQHKFYFSGIRYYVQEACKLNGLVKKGLEKEKGTALLRAARALHEVLGTLNTDERQFLERLLDDESEFSVFNKISGRRLGELKFTTYDAVARLVGIEGGVVSGVFNLESSGVKASDWRPRHDKRYHEA